MSNILYISNLNIDARDIDGVSKKILAQISSMKTLGLKVDFVYTKDSAWLLHRDDGKDIILVSKKSSYRKALPLIVSKIYNKNNRQTNYEIVYIRKCISTPKILLSYYKIFKRSKIILEIPVYPYGGEKLKSFFSLLGFLQDFILNSFFLKHVIDYITNFNGYKCIFGVKCFQLLNSLSENEYDFSIQKSKDYSRIVIGTASSLGYWHGYDRIIEGLSEYYKSKDCQISVYLYIAGEGPELNKYLKLVDSLKLHKYVKFYPVLGRRDLKMFYQSLNIGLTALSIDRKKLKKVSSIKVAELFSAGLPVIYGGSELGIKPSIEQFNYKCPLGSEPINISKVVEWFNKLNKFNEDYPTLLNRYACENLTWESQFSRFFKEMTNEK